MDKKDLDEILDKNLDGLCEKNGYDKEYIKKSCENAIGKVLDDDGNISDEKVKEQMSGFSDVNLSGIDWSAFLTPEMIQNSMEILKNLGGFKTGQPAAKEEYNDTIIEDDE